MQLINLTPHAVTIIIPPDGPAPADQAPRTLIFGAAHRDAIARADEVPVQVDDPAPAAKAGIPITYTSYARTNLPAPQSDTGYIVSIIVVYAAMAEGRSLLDLYVPGQQVRDADGRIIGCGSLIWAPAAVKVLVEELGA